MKILITGATGLIGFELSKLLKDAGHQIICLTGSKHLADKYLSGFSEILYWNRNYEVAEPERLAGFDTVVHLAGAGVADKRWNDSYKKLILESRTRSLESLILNFSKLNSFPRHFISGSATGYYGSRGNEILTETSKKGTGFLSDVCEEWESVARNCGKFGARWVNIRTGIVLSIKGGAFPKMLLPYRLFVGGVLGGGNQWFSWVTLPDIVNIFKYAIENENITGVINGVAPAPVTMNKFSKELGNVLHRPSFFPVPETILKLVLGESAIEIIKSQRVIPEKLLANNYIFRHSTLNLALDEILKNNE